MEEVCALGWKEAVEQVADALDEPVDRSGWLLPQQRLELGEGHLDGVHVGAVGWQVEDLRAACGNRLADAGDLVGGQVVEHNDIAAPERGREDVADVGSERIAIHRCVEHPWCGQARQAQACDEGHRLPMPEGSAVAAAFADRCPAIKPRHLGIHAGLVEEDEALRIDVRLGCSPQLSPGRYVRSVLFGRA